MLLSFALSGGTLADQAMSDEVLLYQHLFPEAERQSSQAQPERWKGFRADAQRERWEPAQVQAMREAFKRKPVVADRETPSEKSAGAHPYQDLVSEYASAFGLDPLLVHQVIQAESDYDANAISPKGAKGLMQLMDGLSRQFNINPFDPESNIKVGTGYLAELLERFGRVDLALAAYNAGPSVVEKYGGIPPYPETQQYVSEIIASLGAPTGR